MTLFFKSQLPETGSVKLLVGGRSRDAEHESSNCKMHISYQSCLRLLRPRPNVELFMRRTKLSEFKVHEKFDVDAWLSLDRPDQHVLQTDRTSEDRLRDKHRSSPATS